MTEKRSIFSHTSETDIFLIVCCLAAFIVYVAYAFFFVPMNMDEAGIYHALACLDHPFASFNIFRETCFVKNDLTFQGGFVLLRPQFYTGLFHSLLYAPFYFLLHSQVGQYLFGLIFFMLYAFAFSRLATNRALAFALTCAFFPFVIQFIHDTGPIKFALLLFPLSALALQKIIASRGPIRYGYATLISLAFFCAAEEKAFFIYLLPSIFLFSLASITHKTKSLFDLKKQLLTASKPLLVMALLSTLLSLPLLFATNKNGDTYILWLINLAGKKGSLGELVDNLLTFLFYWPAYSHNYFSLDNWSVPALCQRLLTFSFLASVLTLAVKTKMILGEKKLSFIFLLFSALVLVVVYAVFRNTWAGHHYIYFWPPVLLVIAEVIAESSDRVKAILIAAFITLNLLAMLSLTQQDYLTKAHKEKDAIFEYFNNPQRAENAIYNFTTWGGYYIQALYGPKNQIVTYTEPYEEFPEGALYPQYASKLIEIQKVTGRRLYSVCYEPCFCSASDLERAFDNKVRFKEVLIGLRYWKVFEAER